MGAQRPPLLPKKPRQLAAPQGTLGTFVLMFLAALPALCPPSVTAHEACLANEAQGSHCEPTLPLPFKPIVELKRTLRTKTR